MNVMRCAVIALCLSSLRVAAQDPDSFKSATAGFSLKKPADWTILSRLTEAELQKAIDEERPGVRLVVMTKEPFGNFAVTLIPRRPALVTASAKQVLELLVLPPLQKSSPDFALESPVREVEISGHAAAEYVATDVVRSKVGTMRVRIRAILVPRGKLFFLIDMIAPAAREQFHEDLAKIVSSITIDK